MRHLVTFAGATVLALLVLQLPAPAARNASCTRRVYVTFFVYSTFPPPRNTRCWSYERPPQSLGRWHICHWDKPTNGKGPNWIYDDTSPGHRPASAETSKVAACARGGGPLGYVAMARKNGAWRRTAPRGVKVTRYYAETYTSEGAVDNAFPAWLAKRSVGAPIVNVGHASLAATYAATYRACRAIPRSTYMGIYSSTPVTAGNGKRAEIQKALNACTTRA